MKQALKSIYLGAALVTFGFQTTITVGEQVGSLVEMVTSLQAQLDIPEETEIEVVIESDNEKLISVRRSKGKRSLYVLSFDREFLQLLDEEDLKAAIAHELGHVWIFTHHPYLQTETLANRYALKLVPRDSLERVYEKMFSFRGESHDMEGFLGF